MNTKGVTLLEAMLSMGLVAIIALSSVTFFNEMSKSSHRSSESCRLYNAAFLDRIRSFGAIGNVGNFAPVRPPFGSPIATDATAMFNVPIVVPSEIASTRFPSVPALGLNPVGSTTYEPPPINNYLLINGYMNVLQGLYNNYYPGICTGVSLGSTQPPGTALMIPYPKDMKDATSSKTGMTVQVVPYDLDTGVEQGCLPAPLYIAPRNGKLEDDANTPYDPTLLNNGGIRKVTKPTEVKTKLGFKVKVASQFLNDADKPSSCLTEERFQYNIDNIAPPVPNVMSATMSSPLECTAADTNTVTLTIGFSGVGAGGSESGSMILCKDLSVLPTIPIAHPPATVAEKRVCYNGLTAATGEHLAGKQVTENIPSSYYPPLGQNPQYDYINGTTFKGLQKWRACSEVTACGIGPTNVIPTPSADGITYTLTYKDLPSDCRVWIQAVALDPALNVSAPTAPFDTSMTFKVDWDVPRPRCKAFCLADPATTPWVDGYFTCNPNGCAP